MNVEIREKQSKLGKQFCRKARGVISVLCPALILCVFLSACRSKRTDILSDKSTGAGFTVRYEVTIQDAWRIALQVLKWNDALAVEEYREEGYILAEFGKNSLTEGSLIGVWITPVSETGTDVLAVTRRKYSLNLLTRLSESDFHGLFQRGLDVINRGEELPRIPPK